MAYTWREPMKHMEKHDFILKGELCERKFKTEAISQNCAQLME